MKNAVRFSGGVFRSSIPAPPAFHNRKATHRDIMPSPLPEPDADVIRRWRSGDRAAFEQLVGAWQTRIGRFLTRLTQCPETANDLTQEVFLRVYVSAHKYRETGQFSTWLFQIALNLARDAARKKTRHPTQPLPDAEPPGGEYPGEVVVLQQERSAVVKAALAELSHPLREVVVLRHYEDMGFEEMARLLNTPASTLKSRFTVAMRQLHESLSTLGFGPEPTRENRA